MSKKYRPSLTIEEIQLILVMLDTMTNMDTVVKLRAKLRILLTKVDLGVANPAYTTDPKPGLLSRLGMGQEDDVAMSPQQKREAAYIKYKGMPSSCSDYEVDLAQTYMYENNMMMPEEREAYEIKYFGDM